MIGSLAPPLPHQGLMTHCDWMVLYSPKKSQKTFFSDYRNAGAAKAAGADRFFPLLYPRNRIRNWD